MVDVDLCVVPKICAPISGQVIELVKETFERIGLDLADETDGNGVADVDVLVGADFYWQFFTGETMHEHNGPVALNTVLGWVLSGPCDIMNSHVTTNLMATHVLRIDTNPMDELNKRDESLIQNISKFWEIEEVEDIEHQNTIMKEFQSSVKFDENLGRYIVELPWKIDPETLPDNFSLAKSRLNSLYRRLQKNPKALKEYDDIIRTQTKEGIVEDCDEVHVLEAGRTHYIPHREVIKEERETTKMRIVYDGGAKRTGQKSINDCLESGPCLIPKIIDILVRFRAYKYALISDIKSAFLNIRVCENDRDFLRFLWIKDLESMNPEIITKRFTSVLFGLAPSPFLLNATVTVHMEKYLETYRDIVIKFLRDLYVDDSITGAQKMADAFNLYEKCKKFMLEGGFLLRKWNSNDPHLMQKINEAEGELSGRIDSSIQKVLGVKWNFSEDKLIFDVDDVVTKALEYNGPITKRHMLKTTASHYDPIGILCPISVKFKCVIQEAYQ